MYTKIQAYIQRWNTKSCVCNTENIERRIDMLDAHIREVAFSSNLAKNGMSAYLGEHRVVTRLFTGQKMFVDTRDMSLAPHLILDGFWEEWITRVWRMCVRVDSVVIDVGANFGYFSVVAGATCTEGRIIAFEPNRDIVPYLVDTLEINGLRRISTVVPQVVADRSKVVRICFNTKFAGNGFVLSTHFASLQPDVSFDSTPVDAVSLDEHCKKNDITTVDLIKIDAEGSEDAIYTGMKDIIAQNNLKIFLEFSPSFYSDPMHFFNRMAADFLYIYALHPSGPIRVHAFADLGDAVVHGWTMLLLSKEEMLFTA